MESLVDEGLVKSIGLSNFNRRQIDNILKVARIKPVNLQVEIHANFPNAKLVDYCKSKGITVTAYAPLGSPGASPWVHGFIFAPHAWFFDLKYYVIITLARISIHIQSNPWTWLIHLVHTVKLYVAFTNLPPIGFCLIVWKGCGLKHGEYIPRQLIATIHPTFGSVLKSLVRTSSFFSYPS